MSRILCGNGFFPPEHLWYAFPMTASDRPAEQPNHASSRRSSEEREFFPEKTGQDEGTGGWNEILLAELPELTVADFSSPPRRKRALPIVLFVVTCVSTFWVGATRWQPLGPMGDMQAFGHLALANWREGLCYMAALMGILVTHEMGHFVCTLRYRIAASYPLFIPVPINPIGTMGAIIRMDGLKADRRELFDLGLAGPLAGLVVAIPVLWMGIERLDLASAPPGELSFHMPLLGKILLTHLRPDLENNVTIGVLQLNPLFMAGWVGLLITGLNMLPISQLDGGHVTYSLFGRRAHTIARLFVFVTIAFIVIYQVYLWTMMLILVILMGTDHPPTADDTVRLGWVRWLLGSVSLAIPIFCFPLLGVEM